MLDFILEEEPIATELTILLLDDDAKIILHQMAEICDVARREGAPVQSFLDHTMIICNQEFIQNVDIIEAAELKWEHRKSGKKKFSLADAMMLAVGKRIGETVVTKDTDFVGIDGAIVLGQKTS
jgi:predicted nucleic acid-binding protein